jgi:hypothetical protein
LKGGGADVSVTFWKRIGIAATLPGDRASNVQPGIGVNMIAFLAGPCYTYTLLANETGPYAKHSFRTFGGVHAFNSAFPSSSALKATAQHLQLSMSTRRASSRILGDHAED